MKIFHPLFASVFFTAALWGNSLSYNVLGEDFNERFFQQDGLALGNYDWVDGTTFSGWHALYVTDPSDAANTSTVPNLFRATNGLGVSPIGLYWFRGSASAEFGALGTRHFDGSSGPANQGGIYFGVPITNDTGSAITSFDLGYTGEQWRRSTGGAATFEVSYSTDATSLISGTWSGISGLDFTSPFFNVDTTTSVDGKADENRVVLEPVTIGLSTVLEPGETLWLRWFSVNAPGIDQSIGIDDVRFSAIPEPSTVAFFFASLAMLLALGRRKGWL